MSTLKDRILELLGSGLTQQKIGDIVGVTRQYVSFVVHEKSIRKNRLVRDEKKRRLSGKRTYECGICGQRGHNAQRHR
jgi:predicted transcriptional regulator